MLRLTVTYRYTVFIDLSTEHIATTSKDRTSLLDGKYFKPDRETGIKLLSWLNCEDMPANVSEETVKGPVTVISGNQYRIVNSIAKTKPGGKVFARVTLAGDDGRKVAWSDTPEILDIPFGSTIQAKLGEQNGATIIESYILVEGGAAA